MLSNSWRLASTLNFPDATDKALPVALSYPFRAQLIRTETSVRDVPAKWRRAGYLSQVISVVPSDETFNDIVPLNRRKIFAVPLLASHYNLIFTPVTWLPAGLRVRVWEYTGTAPDEELLKQLLLMD